MVTQVVRVEIFIYYFSICRFLCELLKYMQSMNALVTKATIGKVVLMGLV